MLKLGFTVITHQTQSTFVYTIQQSQRSIRWRMETRLNRQSWGGNCRWFIRHFYTQSICDWNHQTCKNIVGIMLVNDTFLETLSMPTGLHTSWDLESQTSIITLGQNKTQSFETMVMTCFERQRLDCKLEHVSTKGKQKQIDCFIVDGFCPFCRTMFDAIGCSSVPVKKHSIFHWRGYQTWQ